MSNERMLSGRMAVPHITTAPDVGLPIPTFLANEHEQYELEPGSRVEKALHTYNVV